LQNEYQSELIKNLDPPTYRVAIGVPSRGLLRAEWALARFGQIIPCNWSAANIFQFYSQYSPVGYLVADAQNIIVQKIIEQNTDWLLLIEDDVVIPPDCFLKMNTYMREAKVPVVSGLYYSKSNPSEPLVYRGRGNSYYDKWKFGDRVWADGVPTGILLIHTSILKAMHKESEEYMAGNVKVRRVFVLPQKTWFDPETQGWYSQTGTTDLNWCTRIMEGGFFKKAGWGKYQKRKNPFLVDTTLFCKHITPDGRVFPPNMKWSF